jgi:hypothetical protein
MKLNINGYSAGMKFRNKNKFRYGISAYTGPFRPLGIATQRQTTYLTNRVRFPTEIAIFIFATDFRLASKGGGGFSALYPVGITRVSFLWCKAA